MGGSRRVRWGTVLAMVALAAGCAPRIERPGPVVTQPRLEAGTFVAADGATSPVRIWMPGRTEPKAAIIALHGFNDYGNFFADAGAFFAEAGFAAYAYDQRGFGEAAHPGLWAGAEALADDLGAVTELVRGRHPGVPVYLLGASMGGAVIMVAMAGDRPPNVDGVILSAPAVWGRSTMPVLQRAALWVAAHTVPWLKVSGRGLGIKPSDNLEMLKALGRDPLVIKETRIDALYGLADLMDAALEASARLPGPALVLYGEHDEVIPKDPTVSMMQRLPAAGRERRRLALYDGGYHMLLRDLQAKTVWRDIAAWIADANAPLPSGADARAAAVVSEAGR